jgi:hypothetical protein
MSKIKTIDLSIPEKDKAYINAIEKATRIVIIHNPIPTSMFGIIGNKRYGFVDTFIYGKRKL